MWATETTFRMQRESSFFFTFRDNASRGFINAINYEGSLKGQNNHELNIVAAKRDDRRGFQVTEIPNVIICRSRIR